MFGRLVSLGWCEWSRDGAVSLVESVSQYIQNPEKQNGARSRVLQSLQEEPAAFCRLGQACDQPPPDKTSQSDQTSTRQALWEMMEWNRIPPRRRIHSFFPLSVASAIWAHLPIINQSITKAKEQVALMRGVALRCVALPIFNEAPNKMEGVALLMINSWVC